MASNTQSVEQRRNFLKAASAAGIGLSAASISSCGSPSNNAPGVTVVVADPGTFVYDPVTFELALNLGDVDVAGCSYPAESRNYKVRALFHDAMYWKIDNDGELFLQQWHRTSLSNAGADPSIVGIWENDFGHQLSFNDNGTVTFGFTGSACSALGYLGEEALTQNIFRQSVAAGDPAADGFIIWTRANEATGDVTINWEVATDARMTNVVQSGSLTAQAAEDHTVKHTLTGLNADTTYFYRFTAPNNTDPSGNVYTSHVGRAKTLPTGSPDNLRIALLSCSSFPHGYFNAYRQVARIDDLDGVYHLGDYIYDYPGDPNAGEDGTNPTEYQDTSVTQAGRVYRHNNITETITLEDYRLRFRNYREDIDLQLLHTRYSFINTWDDHETANDSYDPDATGPEGGAENHGDNQRDEGPWEDRKAAAAQAYNEWLPIIDVRSKGAGNYNDPRLDRSFSYGDLADLIVLDTRVGGRHHIADTTADDYEDNSRELMSADQRTFMLDTLTGSTATWKLLGQQIMMGHLIGPPLISMSGGVADQRWNCVINNDQWDGYDAERETIFNAIENNSIENFICLTGDIHTSWAIDLVDDPRKRGPLGSNACQGPALNPAFSASSKNFGVEFVTPSITSPGLPDPGGSLTSGLTTNNPHIRAVDLENRGYSIMDITPAKTLCTWYHVNSIVDEEDEGQSLWRIYSVAAGAQVLVDETP